jgi:polyhydroxybutyrate depolymerase
MRVTLLCAWLVACGDDGAAGDAGVTSDGVQSGDGVTAGADAAAPLPSGQSTVTVRVADRDREIVLYVPSSWNEGGPAMVALHGNGDTAAAFLQWTGLDALADAEGIALALPAAIPGHAMGGTDWDAYSPAASNIDLPLVTAARDLLTAGGAGAGRVYLLGFSQGGFLAYRAAMEQSTIFAAVHVASAGDPFGGGTADEAARKIPVDLLVGANDSLVSVARATRDDLVRLAFDHRYTEIAGEGHCCPIMGRVGDAWTWLSSRQL